jgi:hypothetical protein
VVLDVPSGECADADSDCLVAGHGPNAGGMSSPRDGRYNRPDPAVATLGKECDMGNVPKAAVQSVDLSRRHPSGCH